MRVDLFGLTMDAPGVTFYLWSPWRCSALEHRLFDAVKGVPGAEFEPAPDELRVHVTEPKGWKAVVQPGRPHQRQVVVAEHSRAARLLHHQPEYEVEQFPDLVPAVHEVAEEDEPGGRPLGEFPQPGGELVQPQDPAV